LNGEGYNVLTVPEASTFLQTNGAVFPGFQICKRKELLLYEINLLQLVLDFERAMLRIASLSNEKSVVICDRGAVDIRAYVSEEMWGELLSASNTTMEALTNRYDFVIHLVTAADGAEQHYTTVNNSIRSETPEEAKILDKNTMDAWNEHPNRIIAANNNCGFESKLNYITDEVLHYLQSLK